jgi:hypothetical protein
MGQEKKVVFMFQPSFYVGSGIRDEKMSGSGIKNVRIRIRDGKMSGSGIKHPGSATLGTRYRALLGTYA